MQTNLLAWLTNDYCGMLVHSKALLSLRTSDNLAYILQVANELIEEMNLKPEDVYLGQGMYSMHMCTYVYMYWGYSFVSKVVIYSQYNKLLFVLLGTLRPDLIESASELASSKADAIKTHHNDTDLVRELRKQVCAGKAVVDIQDWKKL